jgi:hypothetical protein
MPAPAAEVAPPSTSATPPNPMARRMPGDSPPTRRLMGELALLGGGALLITSSIVQLLLWSDSYRDVDPLGGVLVLLGVLGILLALAVVRYGNLGLVLAGALYLAVTTGLLLLVSGLELLGYQDGLPAPYTARSIAVPIVGLVLLAAASWLISPPSRKPRPAPAPEPEAATEEGPAEPAAPSPLEPPTLVPGSLERIRWPAQRPPMQMVEPPPAAEIPPPASVVEEPMPEEAEAAPEPATAEELAELEPLFPEPLAEPATAAIEAEAEAAGDDQMPSPEPTVEFAADVEPVPDWIPEPIRGQLVREQQILERLRVARGPDDPGTLNTRGNIAAFYLAAGDVGRAADLQEAIAADTARILGDSHPHTRTAQIKAAQWRKLAKKRRKTKVPVSG